jgi:hypothetical protein
MIPSGPKPPISHFLQVNWGSNPTSRSRDLLVRIEFAWFSKDWISPGMAYPGKKSFLPGAEL